MLAMLRLCLMLFFLALFRPTFIEAQKPINRVARPRKPSFKGEAKKEADYVLSIERAVERAEFRRLPEEEALPKDPKQWAGRTAREAALLERHTWISEILPPASDASPGARRDSRYSQHPYHNLTTANAPFLEKRLVEALNEEALDPTMYDDYDDDLKLVKELKDRVGEKVLTAWRKRVRFRPPADKLRFDRGPLIPVHEQLKVPVMMPGTVRSLLQRHERELKRLPQSDTTPRTPQTPPRGSPQTPPRGSPQTPPRGSTPPPSPSRRRYEMEKWLAKFETQSQVLVSKFYTLNLLVSESWISKLWYYSTPQQSRLKMWAFRKMQESIFHVQDWVAVLDDVLVRNAKNVKFNIFYTTIVFDSLLHDILIFWTFLRRRFYLAAAKFNTPYEDRLMRWKKFGRKDRTNDISRHLIYYTMVVRRYVDLMAMSDQITAAYETYVRYKEIKEMKRLERRISRAETRTTTMLTIDDGEGPGDDDGGPGGPGGKNKAPDHYVQRIDGA